MIRAILRADAIFEWVLAAYLILAVALWPEGVQMPDPASEGVLIAVAIALAVAGTGIWWLASAPERGAVIALASANAGGAVLFLAWLAFADGFSAPAAGLVIVVSAALAALAVAEFVALRDPDFTASPG
jgi:hypothetical protein